MEAEEACPVPHILGPSAKKVARLNARSWHRVLMPTLRSQLDALATNFAKAIVAAFQGASLNELVGSDGDGEVAGGRIGRRAR